ncbi:unnamed protein product [Arctia plantaginis]|uniref:Uncharacterized protein n=1 Tax=Arctia plantaginis TaxID=874455 RepID=A0A8S0Z2F3_ARCPL|nr:unnamed protein product [Arctia plantaginis]
MGPKSVTESQGCACGGTVFREIAQHYVINANLGVSRTCTITAKYKFLNKTQHKANEVAYYTALLAPYHNIKHTTYNISLCLLAALMTGNPSQSLIKRKRTLNSPTHVIQQD